MNVIARSEWGARPPKAEDHNFSRDGGVVVHYTAVDSATVTKHWPQCYERWQRHQNYHMDIRGWNDLAYNFGVCKHGFVFEGRGWAAQNGANTPENARTLSICVDVDGDDIIDQAVVVNVNEMIAAAVKRGWARKLRGHYEVSTSGTACPGAQLKRLLDDGTIHLPPLPGPPPSVEPPLGAVSLLGGDVSPLRMQDWARSKGGTDLFVSLAVPARKYSLGYGVNPAVVYGIMGHETRFGRFGGILDVTFNNWGGIKTAQGGANDDPNTHQRFNDHLLGVLAVVQHVAGYAGLSIPDIDIVDPRYHLLAGKRIATIPSDDWTWASSEHDSNVARYAREMNQ